MARTMPIRLRTIAAACVVIASGLLIFNVYKSIIRSSDQSMQALPVISADTSPFRILPDDPGGAEIPNQGSKLFDVLKTDNADPLALNGVNFQAPQPEEPETLFENQDGADKAGFAVPELPETRTESLYGLIEDLKERDERPSQEPMDVVEKGFVKMDDSGKEELQETLQAVLEKDDVKVEEQKQDESPAPETVVAPTEKPKAVREEKIASNDIPPIPKTKPAVPAKRKVTDAMEPKKLFSLDDAVPVSRQSPSTPSYYIQLASLKDDSAARQAYERIARDFPAVVAGVPAAFPQADLGERGVFTRVQIGPLSQSEAQSRCALYTSSAKGGTCLVISR